MHNMIKVKIEMFDSSQKLLPLLLFPMTLAATEEKTLCYIIFQERVVGLISIS